ncbi:MAG: uridine kinase [bacterium]|nr:uridine kinase [bacterium]
MEPPKPANRANRTIAIAGGSGSGKTTLARDLLNALGKEQALIISQDSYYRDQSDRFDEDGGNVNFDHPSALEFSLMAEQLKDLKQGKAIHLPVYDFSSHSRLQETVPVEPKPVILVEGILILHAPELDTLFDIRVYLDIPEAVRFERRLKRDTQERGRAAAGVKRQFQRQVAPMHNQFVQPSKQTADYIYNYNGDWRELIRKILR